MTNSTATKKQQIKTVANLSAPTVSYDPLPGPTLPAPTLEESNAKIAALKGRMLFASWLDHSVSTLQVGLKRFTDGFASEPLSALEWSQGTFEAAGELVVLNEVKQLLSRDEVELSQIVSYCQDQALYGARAPKHSTSPVANYAHQCKTAAYASVAKTAADFLGA